MKSIPQDVHNTFIEIGYNNSLILLYFLLCLIVWWNREVCVWAISETYLDDLGLKSAFVSFA